MKKSEISNYLTFFETIYILYKRDVISFSIIDDLFAYRFFLAVHSEIFQKEKLIAQPENFINIYKLEKEWLDYRISVGKNTRKELDEAYNKCRNCYINGENLFNTDFKNVYEARQLRCFFEDDVYKKLIK